MLTCPEGFLFKKGDDDTMKSNRIAYLYTQILE